MPVSVNSSFSAFGPSRNLAASIALRGLRAGTADFAKVSERLATGSRINRPADDASGFRTVETFRLQMAGLKAALINTQNAKSTLDVALGGMSEIYNTLVSLKSVALKALGSDIASDARTLAQDEAEELLGNIDRIVAGTRIGGNRMLDGSGDFTIHKTENAFDDIRVRRLSFAPGATFRDFQMDVTRVAERASLLTNIDLAGTASLAPNGSLAITLGGPNGSSQLDIRPETTAAALAAQINASTANTGVYASSYISTGAELRFDSNGANGRLNIANDLEFTIGNQITLDLTVGGQVRTVTVTATGDQDADGDVNITAADLQAALNSADLGSFSVLSGIDTGTGEMSLAIRHAGAADFSIGNVANVAGSTLNAASSLFGSTFTGTEPAAARLISTGFTPGAGAREIAVQIFDAGGARTSVLSLLNASPADIIAAMAGIADVTDMGVDSNGQQILRFDAATGVNAFRFVESGPGRTDAADLGLLSDSGGGQGLASRGMAVLGLYSSGFGSSENITLRNSSMTTAGFATLNEVSPVTQGLRPQGSYAAYGVDAVAVINDTRVIGNGFHFEFGGATASIGIDLAPRFGAGSFTNAMNRALSLNYADPASATLVGTRPVSQMYGTTSFAITDANDGLGQLLAADGIIDRLNFRVFRQVPDSSARSGLGFQLTDDVGGREYVSIRSMDTSNLGGLPSSEGLPGTESNELLAGAGTLSQIRRGGAFHLEGDREQIRDAIAVIDRAIEQTIREQAHIGTYQTATLDRNSDYLNSMQEEVSGSLNDIASTDVAADAAALAATQLRVQAVTSVLAQANQLPQTLLQLLG